VSREVARNSDAVSGEYRPFAAHHRALARRARPKQRRTDSNEELCRVVQQRLDKRWSPEQIAAWLINEYPDRVDMRLCHETIYQAIYAPASPLRRDDRPLLRTGRLHEFSQTTGIAVYFCDRASPWQRPTNENTNGLLRDYFPKGTDLSVHTADHLVAVAQELNERPRKTLGWATPADLFTTLLQQAALQ
jgi:IS30 family transposase